MNFDWSAEQDELYQRLRAFTAERLVGPGFSRERWREAGDFGLFRLPVPEAAGGMGLGALSTARAVEALGRANPNMGFNFALCAHLFAVLLPVLQHGSPAQKERELAALCSGEWVGANAITESEAGSDVAAMQATARRDGEDYLLRGQKSYVTNGPEADLFLVYAVTSPKDRYFGISAFLVPRTAPGLSVSPPFHTQGLSGAPTGILFLDDCRVPASCLLGAEGTGSLIFRRSMQWERACLFALYVGAMEAVLERTVAFVKERKQFGRALGEHQAVSHQVAEMKLKLESSRLLLYRACAKLDSGKDPTLEVSLAKVAVSEAAVQVALTALQLHGAAGYVSETGIEALLRDAVPSRIFSGTNEMQKNLIARELGL